MGHPGSCPHTGSGTPTLTHSSAPAKPCAPLSGEEMAHPGQVPQKAPARSPGQGERRGTPGTRPLGKALGGRASAAAPGRPRRCRAGGGLRRAGAWRAPKALTSGLPGGRWQGLDGHCGGTGLRGGSGHCTRGSRLGAAIQQGRHPHMYVHTHTRAMHTGCHTHIPTAAHTAEHGKPTREHACARAALHTQLTVLWPHSCQQLPHLRVDRPQAGASEGG